MGACNTNHLLCCHGTDDNQSYIWLSRNEAGMACCHCTSTAALNHAPAQVTCAIHKPRNLPTKLAYADEASAI
jgi:hypothetical protein